MRQVSLTGQKFGINRLRVKGGASQESVYDLVNAHITADRKFRRRNGFTIAAQLTPGTKGISGFNGKLYVFSATPIAQASPLIQPTTIPFPGTPGPTVSKIWFAQPFLSRIYVAAEFSNGDVYHYWLQNEGAWAASTAYSYLQRVQPIAPNGFVYEVSNAITNNVWTADAPRAVNDEVVPTVAGKFKHKVTAVTGTTPRSSSVEPLWPVVESGTVVEYRSS